MNVVILLSQGTVHCNLTRMYVSCNKEKQTKRKARKGNLTKIKFNLRCKILLQSSYTN